MFSTVLARVMAHHDRVSVPIAKTRAKVLLQTALVVILFVGMILSGAMIGFGCSALLTSQRASLCWLEGLVIAKIGSDLLDKSMKTLGVERFRLQQLKTSQA